MFSFCFLPIGRGGPRSDTGQYARGGQVGQEAANVVGRDAVDGRIADEGLELAEGVLVVCDRVWAERAGLCIEQEAHNRLR